MSSKVDFAAKYVCRLRLNELAIERGLINEKGEPDARSIEAKTGVHYNVIRRMILGETKGIDFVNVTRLCLGLRCSVSDLFEIDAINEKTPPTTP
mgnify:CR=1 FL=1